MYNNIFGRNLKEFGRIENFKKRIEKGIVFYFLDILGDILGSDD